MDLGWTVYYAHKNIMVYFRILQYSDPGGFFLTKKVDFYVK